MRRQLMRFTVSIHEFMGQQWCQVYLLKNKSTPFRNNDIESIGYGAAGNPSRFLGGDFCYGFSGLDW